MQHEHMQHKHSEGEQMKHGAHNHGSSQGDHGAHAGHSIADFKKRFYVSLLVTVPILLLSPLIQSALGFSFGFGGDSLVVFGLATFVFFWGGKPFLIGAKNELKKKTPGMMTLISLAIIVAYGYSSAVVFGLAGKVFFWELATLVDIMLLGHWIEMKSVMGASMALEKLSALIPDKAHLLKDGEAREVETKSLQDGDIIRVLPGEKIPTDGEVVKGESTVNEAFLTGEAEPVQKKPGERVIGGAINEEGSLEIRVKGVGENSYLSKVIVLVKEAQASKSKTQNLADRAAFWLTIIAIVSGGVTFLAWLLADGEVAFAIERMATVLVITCPHALGLAIPLVVAISTTLSAKNGLLIGNRTAFENARKISTVVFDKTGTLTKGEFGVEKMEAVGEGMDEERLLALAGSLEERSEHPVAKAIVRKAKEKGGGFLEVEGFQAVKGKGVEGKIAGEQLMIASPGQARELGIKTEDRTQGKAGTTVFLIAKRSSGNELLGVITLADTIREESYAAVEKLQEQGIKTWMLTGDNEKTAKEVADKLKLEGYFSEVLPDEKQAKIKELQDKGEFVAMVGDGINDAPALAKADVGIAIGAGTDIAAETADIILVNSDPKDIVTLILFGRETYKKMVQNLGWAAGYNVFAIPLAAGVLAPVGILLSPAVGAILMSLSTVVVAVNAKLLKVKR